MAPNFSSSPYNIDKIFCINPSKMFLLQNPGNFKADFFLNLQGIRTQIVKSNSILRERRMDISDV